VTPPAVTVPTAAAAIKAALRLIMIFTLSANEVFYARQIRMGPQAGCMPHHVFSKISRYR
jgi:hypothetical protein